MKTNSFSSFFDNINGIKLDKKQIKIATTKRKNVLVIAGAGSGKTLTIVSRVHYLINNLKVNPKDMATCNVDSSITVYRDSNYVYCFTTYIDCYKDEEGNMKLITNC